MDPDLYALRFARSKKHMEGATKTPVGGNLGGRLVNAGEDARSKSPSYKGTAQRAQTWSRRWEAPLPSRRRAQGAPVSQRGPVQPATWTDRSPGGSRETGMDANGAETRSQPSQDGPAPPPAADAFVEEQQQRRSTELTPESDKAVLPANNGSGPVHAWEPDGVPRTGDRLKRAESATSVASTGVSRNRAGNQKRRRGLWGRDLTPTNDSPPGPSTYVDDWEEVEAPIAETEDGWGGSMEDRRAFKETEGSPASPGAIRSETGGAVRRDTGETFESGTGDMRQEGSGTAFANNPVEDFGYSSETPEILEEPDAFDDAELDEGPFPDITLLAPSEVDEMLPVVPTAEQLGSSWGSAVDVWQRLGAAAFVTLISAKLNMFLLASGSATYPFWGPALKAANRNRALRKKGRHVGFWRTSVLEVEVQRPQRRRYTDQTVAGPVMSRPMVRFLLGDDSGARSQLTLPFNRRYEQIQEGEPAELLVASMHSNFSTFKALKEVYLPVSGLWLSEYPHVNRNLFLDISLDIERARKREMAEGAFETAF